MKTEYKIFFVIASICVILSIITKNLSSATGWAMALAWSYQYSIIEKKVNELNQRIEYIKQGNRFTSLFITSLLEQLTKLKESVTKKEAQ